jgi:hypothetical protein
MAPLRLPSKASKASKVSKASAAATARKAATATKADLKNKQNKNKQKNQKTSFWKGLLKKLRSRLGKGVDDDDVDSIDQDALEQVIVKLKERFLETDISFEESALPFSTQYVASPFPRASYDHNPFYEAIGPFGGLLMVLSMLYPTSALIKVLVEEKETRVGSECPCDVLLCLSSARNTKLTISMHFISALVARDAENYGRVAARTVTFLGPHGHR